MYKAHSVSSSPFLSLGLRQRIVANLASARGGDRDAESRLVTRIGEVRATWRTFNEVPDFLQDAVKEAVTFLRQVGRKIDFKSADPGCWVSGRDGLPRRLG